MSYEAMSWAMAQPVEKSSAKFVLVAMANCVNGEAAEMLCWPSTQHLADATAQDRKTVMDNVRRLRDAGYIEDTGERKGATGQVAVYRLKTPENGTVKAKKVKPEPSRSDASNGTESGTVRETVPKTEPVPKTDTNGTEFPYQQSRFSLSTVPKTGHGTSKEPVKNQEGTRKEEAHIDGVPDDLLRDYLALRKTKKAGPLTGTALSGLRREADKAGLTLAQAITACCEFDWRGFNAKWYAERIGKSDKSEPAWRTEQRIRTQIAAPGVATTYKPADQFFLEVEATDVTPRALD